MPAPGTPEPKLLCLDGCGDVALVASGLDNGHVVLLVEREVVDALLGATSDVALDPGVVGEREALLDPDV